MAGMYFFEEGVSYGWNIIWNKGLVMAGIKSIVRPILYGFRTIINSWWNRFSIRYNNCIITGTIITYSLTPQS